MALLVSASAFAGNLTVTEKLVKELPDSPDSVWISNPVGDVEIVGSDSPGLLATVYKTTTAPDRPSLK